MTIASDAPRRRLDSWKEIAEYLGRDVRTVMRWAKSHNLPVRRIGTGRSRPVFAYVDELDQWLQSQRRGGPWVVSDSDGSAPLAGTTEKPRFRTALRVFIALLIVSASLAAAFRWRSGAPRIARATVVGSHLLAFGAGDRELWRYPLPRPQDAPQPSAIRVADDGRRPKAGATSGDAHCFR